MSANKLFRPQSIRKDVLDVVPQNAVPVVGIVLICVDTDRVALFQRNSNDSGAGEWEFPGGKVELGESWEQALVREAQEEIAIIVDPEKISYLGEWTHVYPSKTIHLILFRYDYDSQLSSDFKLVDHQAFKWVTAEELYRTNLSGADQAFLNRLKNKSVNQT